MTPKVHFVCTQTELGEGPVKAVCGKEIGNPQKCFIWDEIAMGERFRGLGRNECQDCFKMIFEEPSGIVYGIREKEERRDE